MQKSSTDYCETCTKLRISIVAELDFEAKKLLINERQFHRDSAKKEYKTKTEYKT